MSLSRLSRRIALMAAVDPSLQGLYCEFGVFTATTINFHAEVDQVDHVLCVRFA